MNSRTRITLIGLIYISLIGLVDLITTRGMNFDLFYLLGCGVVGWAAGTRAGVLVAVVSGVFLGWDGAQTGGGALPAWVSYWNVFVRWIGCIAAAWLAAEVGRLTRGLERTVQERTAWVQSEVEEHKETSVRQRETVELFKQVTDNITEVFWVTDTAKSRFNFVSRGFESIWGLTRQQLYSAASTWLEAIHPADRERVARATYTRQITGDYDEEYRVVRPDGTFCWVHDRAFPVLNEKKEVYRIVGITEDVTERKRAEQLVEAQRDVGVALSLASDLNVALERLLETVTRVEGLDCGGVYLLNEETGTLDLEAHLGLPPAFVVQVAQYGANSDEVRRIHDGRMLCPVCGEADNTEGVFWSGGGLLALAVIPLQYQGQALGALALGSHVQYEIPLQTQVVLEAIATQAAGVIARIRLERQILEISDREQARIGQDIHDGLCQQLIGMAFRGSSLRQTLQAQHVREAGLAAANLCTLLDEAITESRRVCRGLYPVRLKTEGLVPALEELATTTSERFSIQCGCVAVSRRLQCDVITATHLYRIAQEAVNNALKHSGAQAICIRLIEPEGGIELQIVDDGRGIPEAPGRKAGMGLHIMDYRARSIGGKLQVRGEANGTVVSCRIPHPGPKGGAGNGERDSGPGLRSFSAGGGNASDYGSSTTGS